MEQCIGERISKCLASKPALLHEFGKIPVISKDLASRRVDGVGRIPLSVPGSSVDIDTKHPRFFC